MPGFVSWPGPMRQYLLILRTPHVARLFAASLLARLPMGINGLAIVLMVKAETGSFGNAGAAAGALALGTGLCAPLTARLIDARGARMLLVLAAACAAGLVAVIVLAHRGAPPARSCSPRSRPAGRSRRPRPCCARSTRACSAIRRPCCRARSRSTPC